MDYIVTWKWTRGQGTFIPGTGGATVGEVRVVSKKKNTVMVKEDLLHLRISEYGLVSPVRSQNPVWRFYQKYGCKKYQDHLVDNNLQLSTQVICMLCYQHEDKRRVVTFIWNDKGV